MSTGYYVKDMIRSRELQLQKSIKKENLFSSNSLTTFIVPDVFQLILQ